MDMNVDQYADQISRYTDMAIGLILGYAPRLFLAILTLFIGFLVVRIVVRGIDKGMRHQHFEASLRGFLVHLISIVFKALILISVATMVGIQMTSFIALIGAAGLAVGLALQGSLANFAGGILILLFKPFKVGDYIRVEGHEARVKKIEIFTTVVKTRDNRTIFVPNGDLSNGTIINYSTESTRRADIPFGIGYSDDIKKAKEIMIAVAKESKYVLVDPEPFVVVSELGDSSVNFSCRVWCKSNDYWSTVFDMNERVKLAFDKEGISIPFPQRDVHLYQE